MNNPNDWLQVVAIAQESGGDTWSDENILVRRIMGGNNNALYQIAIGQETYACKLCVPDFRHRAAQEYSALRLLQTAGLTLSRASYGQQWAASRHSSAGIEGLRVGAKPRCTD
jgi:hypothetical protein